MFLQNFYFRIRSYASQYASEDRHTLGVVQISPYLNIYFFSFYFNIFFNTRKETEEK